MSGKVKSLHGVYKALGRDAFLAAAKIYSDHVQKTVEATLSQMESHWYDAAKTVTEAEEMVNDYNFGFLTKERAAELLEQERLQEAFLRKHECRFEKRAFCATGMLLYESEQKLRRRGSERNAQRLCQNLRHGLSG